MEWWRWMRKRRRKKEGKRRKGKGRLFTPMKTVAKLVPTGEREYESRHTPVALPLPSGENGGKPGSHEKEGA